MLGLGHGLRIAPALGLIALGILIALLVGGLALLGEGLIPRALLWRHLLLGCIAKALLLAEPLLIARTGLLGIALGIPLLLVGLLITLLGLITAALGIALLLITRLLGIALRLIASTGHIARLLGLLSIASLLLALLIAIAPARHISIVRTAVVHPYTFTFLPPRRAASFILQACCAEKKYR